MSKSERLKEKMMSNDEIKQLKEQLIILKEKNKKLRDALIEISKKKALPCNSICNLKKGKCYDGLTNCGKYCPVGIAKRTLNVLKRITK